MFRLPGARVVNVWTQGDPYVGGARYFFKVRKVYKLMHFPLEVIFTGAKSEELIDGERSYGLSKVLQPVPSEIDTNWTN